MKILIAPDSFKGTYTAAEVAAHIAAGVREGGGPHEILRDATASALVEAHLNQSQRHTARPYTEENLIGRSIRCWFASTPVLRRLAKTVPCDCPALVFRRR
ncbi:glycerate kinase [Arthrobacter sp.]|uniref:glycerate kinase n=1 Tax=Arthrobacter sp. TaxID=1667 RepID=UPI003395D7F2